MPARRTLESCPKAAVSLSEMAEMLGMSRSRLYQLIEQGVFEPPVYCIRTRRPFFPAEVQRRNLLYRQTNTGADGQFVVFYRQRQSESRTPERTRQARSSAASSSAVALAEELKALGMTVATADIESALAQLFPSGTDGVDESELLRVVFRHFRRSTPVAEPS